MSFKCLCKERDDGDLDVIVCIQTSGLQDELNYSPELFMQDMLEKFHYQDEIMQIVDAEVITDVISN